MSGLETRQLRYFVAVAEERHFGRAAERLGMAQPPLSRAIRDLERQLGVALLTRTTRQVTLTPAGETLLDDARVALDAVAAAEHRARRAGRSGLRLALKADFDGGLLPAILDAYGGPVDLLLGGPGDQERALREGRADVALLPGPYDPHGLDAEPLLSGPTVVALPAADPLTARATVRLADLAGRHLPYGSPAERGRVAPPPASRLRDLSQIFNLVEVGSAVWFLPDWVAGRFPRPGIAYRPVEDLDPVPLSVVWPAVSRSPAVAALTRVAHDVAASLPVPAL
ncbi:DNA-binding transcriptional LysR family regulator [Catenuloplanes nepalensis]|uniref:DNA-binding transcriptional LysR family regulator n=1 Tax=Catenuloplanes nepalensis TaxID=587533 RepID=A0ABT9MT26_9ACTN|nr:LysR family transcriptional regulator [Catenuloplanes nepalensis]MDP9794565.1 DNA-binding transcriptional LysR family regulator [Catenuloplanes nepalensis]